MKFNENKLPTAWMNESGQYDAESNVIVVGSEVEANWFDEGYWFPGTCVGVYHEPTTYDVKYNDGDYEANIGQPRIRLRQAS